jgi:hypothetical protein
MRSRGRDGVLGAYIGRKVAQPAGINGFYGNTSFDFFDDSVKNSTSTQRPNFDVFN